MTRRLMGLAGVASMICFAGSVPSAPVQTPGAAAEDPSVKGLVSGNVDFSFKLLRLLADGKPKDNIFISPISIGIGLCMELNGAGGATQTDIAAAVGLGGLSRDEANTANRTGSCPEVGGNWTSGSVCILAPRPFRPRFGLSP